MKKIILFALVCSVIFALTGCQGEKGPAGPAGASLAVANFQDGAYPNLSYFGTSNARLTNNSPDINNTLYFSFGVLTGTTAWRALARFDVSELTALQPSVKKAYLTFYANAGNGTATITAYAVTKAWVESEVTWNSYSAGNPWTTPGGDYGAVSSNTIEVSALGQSYTLELNASLVQAWVNTPAQNYGVIIKALNETTGTNRYHCNVRTNAPPELSPKLTIYYTVP